MRAVFLSATKVDFDGAVDFSALEAVAELTRHGTVDPTDIPRLAAGCQVVISKEVPLRSQTIAALPETVALICEAGTGTDNIDLAAARERGILVCNAPGYSTGAVAQLTLTFVLMLFSGTHQLLRRAGQGDQSDHRVRLGSAHHEVAGRTLGLIGVGAIGGRVAELARAVGLRVLVPATSRTRIAGVERVSREALLARSDVVSLHCPLTPDTRHLVDADFLATMRSGAFLVNTSRGGLVDHTALTAALERGHLAGAALDVQDPEPLPADHPLWSRPDVILTPHMGWKAHEARSRLIEIVADNLASFAAGSPVHVVS